MSHKGPRQACIDCKIKPQGSVTKTGRCKPCQLRFELGNKLPDYLCEHCQEPVINTPKMLQAHHTTHVFARECNIYFPAFKQDQCLLPQ